MELRIECRLFDVSGLGAGVRRARRSPSEEIAIPTEMIDRQGSSPIWGAIIGSCPIAIAAIVTKRAFLSPESSGGAILVYSVRGVETSHGGAAGSKSALRWVEEESRRWQIES